MSDEKRRALERRAKQGDPEAIAAMVRLSERAGEGSLRHLDRYTVESVPADYRTDSGEPAEHHHDAKSRGIVVLVGESPDGSDPCVRHPKSPLGNWDRRPDMGPLDDSLDILGVTPDVNALGAAIFQLCIDRRREDSDGTVPWRVLIRYTPDPTEDPVIAVAGTVIGPCDVEGIRYRHGRKAPELTDETILAARTNDEAFWCEVPYTAELYGADSVCRSNYRSFLREHGDALECGCVVAAHGYIYVKLGATCEHREGIKDILAGLDGYPLIDDSDHSEMEMDEQNEAWSSWGRSDIKHDIADHIGLDRNALDDVSDEAFDTWYWEWCRESGRYPGGTDDNLTFPNPVDVKRYGPNRGVKPDPAEMLAEMIGLGGVDVDGATVIRHLDGTATVARSRRSARTHKASSRKGRAALRESLLREMRRPMWASNEQHRALDRLARTRKGMRAMLDMVPRYRTGWDGERKRNEKRGEIGAHYRAAQKERR